MGTRGIVGLGAPQRWAGAYNHADSMPEVLGPRLWHVLQGYGPTPAGVAEFGRRLRVLGRFEPFHDPADDCTPLWVEWDGEHGGADPFHIPHVYLVEPDELVLIVLFAVSTEPSMALDGYTYVEVARVPLAGQEPRWRDLGLGVAQVEQHEGFWLLYLLRRFGPDPAGTAIAQELDKGHDAARPRADLQALAARRWCTLAQGAPAEAPAVFAAARSWLARHASELVGLLPSG